MLQQAQIEQFQRDGFLVVENVMGPEQLSALRHQLENWVD